MQDRHSLNEHYEECLNRVSHRIRKLEDETRRAGRDADSSLANAIDELKRQRVELAQSIDRFEMEDRIAVDEFCGVLDTAFGNLEERLRGYDSE